MDDHRFKRVHRKISSKRFLFYGCRNQGDFSKKKSRPRKCNITSPPLALYQRNSPQSLKKAVIAAAEKDPKKPLSRVNNFREKWDFLRFVWLVEALDKKDEAWKRFAPIKPILDKCRRERNDNPHDDLISNKAILDDDELMQIILSTRKYILTLNGLNKDCQEGIKIGERLERLRHCLYQKKIPEFEHDVTGVAERKY
jgi:hypothetical protein